METRILLVNLLSYSEEPAYLEAESLGLGYVAASLRREGFPVRLMRAPAADAERIVLDEIERFDPRLVGFSPCFDTILAVAGLCRRIKAARPEVRLCLGGHQATFQAAEILRSLPAVDIVVRGEGERPAVALARALETGAPWNGLAGLAFRDDGRIVENPLPPKIQPLDELPFPARDILDDWIRRTGRPASWAMVLSSRGCHGRCSFCSVSAFYRLHDGPACRYRSAANVADEIEELAARHGVVSFLFEDDNFVNPTPESKAHVRGIAEELLRRKAEILFGCSWRADSLDSEAPGDRELVDLLKRAGLFSVFLGLEAGQEADLAIYQKEVRLDDVRAMIAFLRGRGLSTTTGFIMFNPYSTLESVSRNAAFLRDTLLGLEFRVFSHRVQLQPGVTLAQRLELDKLLLPPKDLSDVYHYEFREASVRAASILTRELYARVAPTDGRVRSAALDAAFILRKLDDLRAKVRAPGLDQEFACLSGRYTGLLHSLNEMNHASFQSILRLATGGEDVKGEAFLKLADAHEAESASRCAALEEFCRETGSFMDALLARLLPN